MADPIQALKNLIATTHQHGLTIARHLTGLERLNRMRRERLARLEAARAATQDVTMYDSVDITQIPPTAQAVAGYVGGHYQTYAALTKIFPKAKRLSIAVNSTQAAECLDIETGDATPEQAPSWVRRQHARQVARPVLYANLSTMPAVQRALTSAGIPRSQVRLWVADYTYSPHIPPGYDACQYTDRALGRNLDASLTHANFWA